MSTFQRSFFFVFVISIVAVAASIGLEVFAKIEPCYLCKVQRICHFSTMLLAAVGIISSSQMKKKMAILLLVLSFSNLSIASYHFGVQLGVFTDVCAVISPATLTDFRSMLFRKQQSHACSSIAWFFGLPIVVWGMLTSFVSFATIAATLRRVRSYAPN